MFYINLFKPSNALNPRHIENKMFYANIEIISVTQKIM